MSQLRFNAGVRNLETLAERLVFAVGLTYWWHDGLVAPHACPRPQHLPLSSGNVISMLDVNRVYQSASTT
jgi:hypothetical protein